MQHLILDLYGCNPMNLVDREHISSTFSAIPTLVEMQQVSPTLIYDIITSDPADDGMSGFIVIATSHLAFHAWPEFNMLNFDLFSCEPYDEDAVIAFLQEKFEPTQVEINHVNRGLHSPRPQKHAANVERR